MAHTSIDLCPKYNCICFNVLRVADMIVIAKGGSTEAIMIQVVLITELCKCLLDSVAGASAATTAGFD